MTLNVDAADEQSVIHEKGRGMHVEGTTLIGLALIAAYVMLIGQIRRK